MKLLRIYLPLLLGLVVFGTPLRAADLPNAGQLLREKTPQPEVTPLQQPLIEGVPEERPVAASEAGQIPVSGFVFHGNTLIPPAEIEALMAPLIGRTLSLSELDTGVQRITRAYRERGYLLASAYLPPQTISRPGQPIRVEITEGQLEALQLITAPEKTRTPRSLLEAYRAQVPVGQAVDANRLTETALRLNELPALRARILLAPGSEPGNTRGTLEVTEGKAYSLMAFFDNYGSPSSGTARAGVCLDLYSPLRRGDEFSLCGHSTSTGRSQNLDLSWSLPVTSRGARLALDYSRVRYELGGDFASLDAEGDAQSFGLEIRQPQVRRANLFVDLFARADLRQLDDRIESFNSHNKRNLRSLQGGLNITAADALAAGGTTSFNLTWTVGKLSFDDEEAKVNDQGAGGLDTAGNYGKIFARLARTQKLSGPVALHVGLTGQISAKNLDSAEKLSFGGPSGVRAYAVGDASADQGLLATIELRGQLPQTLILPGQLELVGLLDYACAEIDHSPVPGTRDNERHLSGAGVGLNWRVQNRVSLRSSLAWTLSDTASSSDNANTAPAFYLQAVVWY